MWKDFGTLLKKEFAYIADVFEILTAMKAFISEEEEAVAWTF